MVSRKYVFFFISVFVLLVCVRVLADFPVRTFEDHDIAINLMNDGELYYNSDGAKNYTFQFPIYPFLVSVLYSFFGVNTLAVSVLNIFTHVLSAWLLYLLFKLVIDYIQPKIKPSTKDKIIFLSIIAFLFHPILLLYSFYYVIPFSLNVLSIFAGLYFSIRVGLNPIKKNLIYTGVIIGLAMLDRATVLLTLFPASLILLQKFRFVEALKKGSLVLGIIALIISPWLVRNYFKDGIIGFESSAAKNIWKGVLYNSDGSNYLLNGQNYYAALSKQEIDSLVSMSPIQQRDFFKSKYFIILKKDPSHVVKMFFVKLKNFWWFREGVGTEWGKWKAGLIFYKFIYGLVLGLIAYLVYLNPQKGLILLSFPIALSILQAYFYVETRHRILLDPFFFFLSIFALYQLLKKFRLFDDKEIA